MEVFGDFRPIEPHELKGGNLFFMSNAANPESPPDLYLKAEDDFVVKLTAGGIPELCYRNPVHMNLPLIVDDAGIMPVIGAMQWRGARAGDLIVYNGIWALYVDRTKLSNELPTLVGVLDGQFHSLSQAAACFGSWKIVIRRNVSVEEVIAQFPRQE